MERRPRRPPPITLWESDGPLPPITRKRGDSDGVNGLLLARMKPGKPVFGFTFTKLQGVRNAAYRLGYQVRARRVPDTDIYALEVTSKPQ